LTLGLARGAGAASSGVGALRASELAVPATLPAGARVLAVVGGEEEGGAAGDPVIWQRPVGRGRLVVSGALDAWRFRAGGEAGFDAFWREVIADAASAAPAPIVIDAAPRVARPGQVVRIDAALRDIVLQTGASVGAATETRVEARLEAVSAPSAPSPPVRLWPDAPGRLRGHLRLPEAPGSYRLVVDTDAGTSSTELHVIADAAQVEAVAPAVLEAWAKAQGGALIPPSRLETLGAALDAAIPPQTTSRRVHPLRSAWWIVPFALALGGEWSLRRRRVAG
jgi:hypothetical protein